jgi:ferric-chelate reductase
MSAPSAISCFTSPGLVLGARVNGDWTRALNSYASNGQNDLQESKGASGHCQVHVMLDGPYGGCSVDIGKYESALLICGGSGATFNVGLLDDIVGRCIKAGRIHGERTRRIEFAWCTRSFGTSSTCRCPPQTPTGLVGSINWFAPQLFDIARLAAGSSLDLHISVFVTCLCDPEAVPKIPNMTVTVIRPSVTRMLTELLTSAAPRCDVEGASSTSPPSVGNANACPGSTGGVAVCVSGPESLTRAVQNAVARLTLTRGVTLGGIALHAELFEV